MGLHQGSAQGPFFFAQVIDRLTDEVREESPWTVMFADDIEICSEREQLEESFGGILRREEQDRINLCEWEGDRCNGEAARCRDSESS